MSVEYERFKDTVRRGIKSGEIKICIAIKKYCGVDITKEARHE